MLMVKFRYVNSWMVTVFICVIVTIGMVCSLRKAIVDMFVMSVGGLSLFTVAI